MAGFSRGQSSVEFLIILSVAIVIFTAVVLLSQQKLGDVNLTKEQDDAKNAVMDLSSAAKEVYSQGEGARKQVYIYIPTSYDPDLSAVGNKTIKLLARGTHYTAMESFNVRGALPRASGGHFVWVISEGNGVRIGTSMLSLTKNSLYIVMNRNSTATVPFSAQSLWDQDITVAYTMSWPAGNVSASLTPGSPFSLDPVESQDMEFRAVADADSIGFYNSEIVFTASDAFGSNETVRLPVTVEVVGLGVGIIPPLSILPPIWNETLMPGDNITKTFTICTGDASPTMVTFTPSVLPPGTWVGSTNPLASMTPNTCLQKTLSLSVPTNAPVGLYTGAIVVEGQGVQDAADTISMYIWVGGAQNDTIGPNVTSITYIPSKIYANETVQFYITGSDIDRGNNTIRGCEMKPDNTTWQPLLPSDGAYDQMLEAAYIDYTAGFTVGNHTVYFRCTDVKNNTGPVSSVQLKVMGNFLVVLGSASPSGDENNWLDWLGTHNSSAGFRWNYTITPYTNVESGAVNIRYYSVLIFADYPSSNNNIPARLQTYVSNGGRVVCVGKCLEKGPRDWGLTSKSWTGGTSSVYITSNSHYITESFNQSQSYVIGGSSTNSLKEDYIGEKLAVTPNDLTLTVLGDSGGYLIWGRKAFNDNNANGDLITSNLLDYALLQSSVAPP